MSHTDYRVTVHSCDLLLLCSDSEAQTNRQILWVRVQDLAIALQFLCNRKDVLHRFYKFQASIFSIMGVSDTTEYILS
ncbi:hypothetical protein NIES2135_09070 [Leptolyngbya boryana NIES-2135]|jgi:hypothetical protein|uniref:Uncharacterized protein n=1 Tax=Leptolyngbya boryana NIES-2135 TaxID=1973484 RepID=A0A1Z4JBL3_LEPBY|nr:hypothetical protein NIES2135_09070 [Leptolyngbya boryana NIES-2135]